MVLVLPLWLSSLRGQGAATDWGLEDTPTGVTKELPQRRKEALARLASPEGGAAPSPRAERGRPGAVAPGGAAAVSREVTMLFLAGQASCLVF